jgi:predicted porin
MADGKKIKTSSKATKKNNSPAKGYQNKPFYVNIAFSGQRIDLEQTNGTCCTTSDSLSDEKHKDQEAGMKVGFGYDFRINDKTTIRLGLDYDPIKNTTTYKTTNLTWSNEADLKFRFSDQIDLFLAPTFMLTDSLSIYFKAGYSSMAAEWGDGGSKQRLHGYTIGLGFDHYLSNDFFLYNSVTASKFSKDDLKGTLVSGGMQANTFADFDFLSINYDVGIGYRF